MAGCTWWTFEQNMTFIGILDTVAGPNFKSFEQCMGDIQAKINPTGELEKFSPLRIGVKISRIAKNMNTTRDNLLKGWEQHGPVYKKSFKTGKRKFHGMKVKRQSSPSAFPAPHRSTRTASSTSTLSAPNSEERKEAYEEAPTQQIGPVLTQVRQVEETPTVSEFCHDLHFEAPDREKQTSVPQPEVPVDQELMKVDEWERLHIQYLRKLQANPAYSEPFDKTYVHETLQKSFHEMKLAVDDFLLSHPTTMLGQSNMVEPARDLSELLTGLGDSGSLERKLACLVSGQNATVRSLLRAFIAAAVFEWILNPFDEKLCQLPVSDCWHTEVLGSLNLHNEDAAEKLRISLTHDYIDQSVVPQLPKEAKNIQNNLYLAIVSLSVPPSSPERFMAYEERLQSICKWEKRVEAALLALLEMRAEMAKCSVIYGFGFPAIGDKFNANTMEAAHSKSETFTDDDVVYLCLRPSVFSYDRHVADAPQVLVSRALVLVEGHVADLTMT